MLHDTNKTDIKLLHEKGEEQNQLFNPAKLHSQILKQKQNTLKNAHTYIRVNKHANTRLYPHPHTHLCTHKNKKINT